MSSGASSPTTLITGAAGNLGSRLARHLASGGHRLRLMVHRTPLPRDLEEHGNVNVVSADLSQPETLANAVAGSDVVVHFAGVLFARGWLRVQLHLVATPRFALTRSFRARA